jgi:uncharacterized SAM-binding protein YcdF (DUF218 family)
MQCFKRCALWMLSLAVLGCLVLVMALNAMHGWLSASDTPDRADAIVVLSGDFRRSREAAALYREQIADTVILTRTLRSPAARMLDSDGIAFPRDDDISRQILEKHAVPASAIILIGNDIISTAGEALALQAHFQHEAATGSIKKLLVITSPYHVLRSRIVLRRALPNMHVSVVASRYEDFPQHWWRDQDAARNVLLETAKLTWYLLGGRF